MKNWKKIIVEPKMSLEEVIKIIDKTALQIAIVLDKNKKLFGTVTDGDIRRAILKGLNLKTSIDEVMNSNPFFAYKKTSKNELIDIMKKNSVQHLPIVDADNKVLGISSYSELTEINEKSNVVVIMAGGLGLRLRPLTENIPKPMLLLDDKPILEHIISNFIKEGFKYFYISVNYKSDVIKNYFKNGNKWGIKISYLEEKSQLGTAGALSLLKSRLSEPIIVVNGDVVTNLSISNVIKFHTKENSVATMVTKSLKFQLPFGIPEIKGNDILSINEKPMRNIKVNAGIYVLSPSTLELLPKNKIDMTDFFKMLVKSRKKVLAFQMNEKWVDIGEKQEYAKVKNKIADFLND